MNELPHGYGALSEGQWLELRRLGLGGSEISAVVGLNPYSGPWQVYLDKVGAMPPTIETPYMRLGKLVEPLLTSLYQRRLRLSEPLTQPGLLFDARRPWWRGTPDRLHTPREVGVEFKWTNRWLAKEWGPDGSGLMPTRHRLQCHWYMELTTFKRWDLLVCIGGEDVLAAAGWELAMAGESILTTAWLDRLLQELDLRLYPLRRDGELTSLLADEGEAFWVEHVIPQRPPTLDGSEAAQEYLARHYPVPALPARRATAEESRLMQAYLDADQQHKAWKDERTRLQTALKGAIGPASGLILPDGLRATWPTVAGATTTEWEALARSLGATPEQIDAYTRTRPETRRFSVVHPHTSHARHR